LELKQWLSQHCPKFHCAACGGRNWGVGDLLAAPAVVNYVAGTQAAVSAAPGQPMTSLLPLICQHCGYTMLFSPKKMGLVP